MSGGWRLTLSRTKRCERTSNSFPLFIVFKAIVAVRQLLALHQLDETRIGSFAEVFSSKSEDLSRVNFAPWFAEMYPLRPRTKELTTTEIICISCEPYVILAPENIVSLVSHFWQCSQVELGKPLPPAPCHANETTRRTWFRTTNRNSPHLSVE